MAVPQDPPPPPSRRVCRRQQGRVHRLHFAIRANLPVGTTLRVVTSSTSPPANPDDDGPTGAAQTWQDALPLEHRRLLRDSVELHTTPETYPLWRTHRPVVVIDDGEGGGEAGGGGGKRRTTTTPRRGGVSLRRRLLPGR